MARHRDRSKFSRLRKLHRVYVRACFFVLQSLLLAGGIKIEIIKGALEFFRELAGDSGRALYVLKFRTRDDEKWNVKLCRRCAHAGLATNCFRLGNVPFKYPRVSGRGGVIKL